MLEKSGIVMGSTALAGFVALGLMAAAHTPTTLKDAYKGDFVIGAAINTPEITGQD